jgi:hypothetical protein
MHVENNLVAQHLSGSKNIVNSATLNISRVVGESVLQGLPSFPP